MKCVSTGPKPLTGFIYPGEIYKLGHHKSALYRNDGQAISSHTRGHIMEKFRKGLVIKIFKTFDLSITAINNLTMVNILAVTLDL